MNIAPERIPLRFDSHGVIRVALTRIPLETVVKEHRSGSTPEQIQQDFDCLDLADVYLVIGFYLRHKAEVDAYMASKDAQGEKVKELMEGMPEDLVKGLRPTNL